MKINFKNLLKHNNSQIREIQNGDRNANFNLNWEY